jgi:hypothetical protein
MKRAGFQYSTSFVDDSFVVPPEGEDLEWRREFGYGMAERMTIAVPPDPNVAYRDSLSETDRAQYDAALEGENGCRAVSFAPDENTRKSGAELDVKLREFDLQQGSDAVLKSIGSTWSTCMQRAGFTIEAPGLGPVFLQKAQESAVAQAVAVGGSMRSGKWLDDFRAEELRVARADADCMEPIREDWLKRKAELEGAFVQENRSLLEKAAN